MEQYFKSLANKRNSQEPPFLRFLQYDPKQVRVLTDLFFLVLGQQIKNPLMQHATIYFCIFVQPLWISYYFKILKGFFLLMPLQQELTPVIYLDWKCTSNKKSSKKHKIPFYQPISGIYFGASFEIIFRQK